ncbi:MAG: hypothetical protein ACI8PZ_002109 [Myxococcota bacterium]
MRLLVSMGLRPDGRPTEPLAARLVEVDVGTGRIRRTLAYDTPLPFRSGPAADQEFTCAAPWDPVTLLQPTHTEVLWIDHRAWRVVHRVDHSGFHSLHSAVRRPGGGITVSSAGTDSVLELSEAGALIAAHVLGRSPAPGVDHRTAHHDAYKPHAHHPNHAVHRGGDLFVTGLETAACTALAAGTSVDLGGMAHDGRLREGLVWFTRVDGRVLGLDPATQAVRVDLDLRELSGTRRLLGWCRGVDVVGERLFVGMTMLRSTTHREVARMLLRGEYGRKLPTRVLEIDLSGPRIVRTIPLGNRAGGTIYGVNALS